MYLFLSRLTRFFLMKTCFFLHIEHLYKTENSSFFVICIRHSTYEIYPKNVWVISYSNVDLPGQFKLRKRPDTMKKKEQTKPIPVPSLSQTRNPPPENSPDQTTFSRIFPENLVGGVISRTENKTGKLDSNSFTSPDPTSCWDRKLPVTSWNKVNMGGG